MSRKFTSTVAGASLLIATIGLLGRGIGFIREVVFASYFGIGKDFDIYLVGAVLPITVGTILLYTGQNYFIPSYNNYKQNDTQEFVGRSFITFLFFGLVIAFLLFIAANPIINLYMGDSPASAKETAYYIYIGGNFNFVCIFSISFGIQVSNILKAVLKPFNNSICVVIRKTGWSFYYRNWLFNWIVVTIFISVNKSEIKNLVIGN